ncbi:cytochrome c oxidase subunit 3 [Rhodocytophaga aerolata]|uniref:Cytochrome c oxidase subunit 3 n=1 Tax=Rhodocytophaga aerolata TaxID=455078 RepID=A0ABT8RCA0_9BACT|nr:cytochrome c oxidase subunit 3 [Rhodocytophaga aerolata]MDO1448813.1 cytochrome c oxidase subunit 3 [Rhodocytophaga aerolata]
MPSYLTKRREPFKFMMGVSIIGIILLFVSLSFLYLLRKSSPDWHNFKLPAIFWLSTAIILASSGSLYVAVQSFKRDKFIAYKWLIGLTLLLGVSFILTQIVGWKQLFNTGVYMHNNIAGAFLYTLSGLHILHILGGIIYLGVTFSHALKRVTYVDSFVYSVNPPTQLKLQMVSIYWHFIDILWIYLFVFLLYHHGH